MSTRSTDYLVVGAGAMGMAFTDALIDHADVHVTLVDRRTAPGGHWVDAYGFVQLHQASVFYGVSSTVLGTGALQSEGPEAGLQERAHQREVVEYYDEVLRTRLVGSGRVEFLGGSEYQDRGTSHVVVAEASGEATEVEVRRRVVDATYISPTIPATTPPPFGVADDVRCVPINDLPASSASADEIVIVGSGKTATDGIVWLLSNGMPSDRIVWVRPREPWMINRAVQQPDPAVALGYAADLMEAAVEAASVDEFFLRLEAVGAMLRIDESVVPTMGKAPTLGRWELELLRTVERVVRLGHLRHVTPRELVLDDGVVEVARGSLVVHCAASGLAYPPLVEIWRPDRIRLQPIRAGFPCFGAALAGFVEATLDDDARRNALCPPNAFANTPQDWILMQQRGAEAVRSFGAEPDVDRWAGGCALNPVRVTAADEQLPRVRTARERLSRAQADGLAALTRLARGPA